MKGYFEKDKKPEHKLYKKRIFKFQVGKSMKTEKKTKRHQPTEWVKKAAVIFLTWLWVWQERALVRRTQSVSRYLPFLLQRNRAKWSIFFIFSLFRNSTWLFRKKSRSFVVVNNIYNLLFRTALWWVKRKQIYFLSTIILFIQCFLYVFIHLLTHSYA